MQPVRGQGKISREWTDARCALAQTCRAARLAEWVHDDDRSPRLVAAGRCSSITIEGGQLIRRRGSLRRRCAHCTDLPPGIKVALLRRARGRSSQRAKGKRGVAHTAVGGGGRNGDERNADIGARSLLRKGVYLGL